MRWAWAVAAALLWPQLVLPGGVGTRREPKRPRHPSQRTETLNATAAHSEGPPGSPKPPEASGPEFSDAHMTWLNFVRRPDDRASQKRCRGRDKKPPGSPGPPGPAGAEVTQEALLREFREMLREATERRSSGLWGSLLPEGTGGRLVAEAFHCRLKGPVLVDKKTLVELQGFQAPTAPGAFLRGSGLSLASGRFTAPATAIFQFSASLHLDRRGLQGRARARDTVRVLVCIESLCHRHTSLEAISGLDGSGRIFTVLVQGLLQLQAGQYASVFVDNGSSTALTIQSGSSFSGLLLGT
ncbi:adipolin [Pteronotus mesoamericanus]|uniref:adipolin n=1 Tax=Pteronotus mesoamericanus TaxID=1884717 RepID=UPI0023EBC137|nr:adipolin [Pteronotus parnellii mesoamericanus]